MDEQINSTNTDARIRKIINHPSYFIYVENQYVLNPTLTRFDNFKPYIYKTNDSI